MHRLDTDTLLTAAADLAADEPICRSGMCGVCADCDDEALYDRVAVLTAELTAGQRDELADLLASGELSVERLVFVLRDQAGHTCTDCLDPFKAGATLAADDIELIPCSCACHPTREPMTEAGARAILEPLAPEGIETVESAPRFRNKRGSGRLCSCGVARLMIGTLGHKVGCPEAS